MAMSNHLRHRAVHAALWFNPRSGVSKLSSLKQRTHPRYECRLPVKITTADHSELDAIAVNVGLGGMQLESANALTFNSELKVRFRLPGLDEDTVVDGTVRWIKDGNSGVQFGSLRARDVWALNQLLRAAV